MGKLKMLLVITSLLATCISAAPTTEVSLNANNIVNRQFADPFLPTLIQDHCTPTLNILINKYCKTSS